MDFKPIITVSLEEYLESLSVKKDRKLNFTESNKEELVLVRYEKKKRRITPPLLQLK